MVDTFEYRRPDPEPRKVLVTLGRTEALYGSVQVIPSGIEGRLHMHRATDGFWFVLAGRARFVDAEGGVHAEAARGQGVIIPAGTRYRLDSVGEETLEILHVSSTATGFDVATDFVALD